MLRWILIGAAALVGIIVIFVIVTWSNLDSIIEAAVEKYGSDVTRVQVSLDEASIDPVSGEGALSGLTVGNPAGFETDNAFSLGQIKVGLDTSSLTEDTIVIREIVITRPQVTYEYGTDGSNVAAIQSNVDAFMAQQSGGESAGGEGPKVIVENIYIRGGEVKVRPYVLLWLAGERAVRPTLAIFNEGCSTSRASSQEDEPWCIVAKCSSAWTSRRLAIR
jgi:hypothetical protein